MILAHHGASGAGTGPLSGGALFTIVWNALADVLGTAAAATLLRRAALRAAPAWPELHVLAITRNELEYAYAVPPGWDEPAADPPPALRALVAELWDLLVELTGPVVVRSLAGVPELRHRGLLPMERYS